MKLKHRSAWLAPRRVFKALTASGVFLALLVFTAHQASAQTAESEWLRAALSSRPDAQKDESVNLSFNLLMPNVFSKVENHGYRDPVAPLNGKGNGNGNGKNGNSHLRVKMVSTQQIYTTTESCFLQGPRSLFFDTKNREIYAVDGRLRIATIFSEDGYPQFSFGYNGELKEPGSIARTPNGKILIVDGGTRSLKVFSFNGLLEKVITSDGFQGLAGEVRFGPMTVGPDGLVYVFDSNSLEVLVLNQDWQIVQRIGRIGSSDSRFRAVTDISVGADSLVYVTDATALPVQVFDQRGRFVRAWGEHDMGPQNFSLPTSVAADGHGRVYVADSIRQEVKIFTSDGYYLGRFGGYGFQPGDMASPEDIVSDGNGYLLVAEGRGGRIQTFQSVSRNGGDSMNARKR